MKATEEAAKECLYSDKEFYNSLSQSERELIIPIFKQGVEFAQRWISIEEELPKTGSDLLLVKWLGSKGIIKYGLATYVDFFSIGLSKKKYLDFIIQGSCKRGVTHWRPIELK